MGNIVVQQNSAKNQKAEITTAPASEANAARFAEAFTSPLPEPKAEPRAPHHVEVFIHDSRLVSSGSQFGHVSIAVGEQLYSMSHNGLYQTNVDDFMNRQQTFRDTVGFKLDVTSSQAKTISDKMLEFDGTTYDLFTNSCTTTVTTALEAAGIPATDPRFFPWSATPTELITALKHSPHVTETNTYDKQ